MTLFPAEWSINVCSKNIYIFIVKDWINLTIFWLLLLFKDFRKKDEQNTYFLLGCLIYLRTLTCIFYPGYIVFLEPWPVLFILDIQCSWNPELSFLSWIYSVLGTLTCLIYPGYIVFLEPWAVFFILDT